MASNDKPLYTGRVHNARACTIDGRDCFVASILSPTGRFSCRPQDVSEHDTEQAAVDWLRAELRGRGVTFVIEVDTEGGGRRRVE